MEAQRDQGLDGVRPFRFACHRCGNCCSGHSGYVWLEEGEIERMAAALGATSGGFARLYVRNVVDPRTGELRSSLRELGSEGGPCVLLVGKNTCSVYEARPEQCRTFPYWPSVLTEQDAFEAARSTCPGIAEAANSPPPATEELAAHRDPLAPGEVCP